MRSRWLFLVVWLVSTPGTAEELLELTPVKVSAHCYYVQGLAEAVSPENQGFISNAGFVVTRNGVVVFDALATPPLAQSLIRAIAKVTPQPIKRVIVSHYHADHFYGLQVFKALGAEIWAHRRGQEYLGSELAQKRLEQQREDLFPGSATTPGSFPPTNGSMATQSLRSAACISSFTMSAPPTLRKIWRCW